MNQGSMHHAEFRSYFEAKLDEMEDASLDVVHSSATLRRKYLSKLNKDLRGAVLGKMWPLDGMESASRKPNTWEEVAQAVELELEGRADAKAPLEAINVASDGVGAPGAFKCRHCGRGGHRTGRRSRNPASPPLAPP